MPALKKSKNCSSPVLHYKCKSLFAICTTTYSDFIRLALRFINTVY